VLSGTRDGGCIVGLCDLVLQIQARLFDGFDRISERAGTEADSCSQISDIPTRMRTQVVFEGNMTC